MKKFDKKGFTIVELVIVIAVIAILAGIMIPTFSNVTATAKESALEQKAIVAYKNAYALDMGDDGEQNYSIDDTKVDVEDGVTFTYEKAGETVTVKYEDSTGTATYANGVWTVTLK